MPFSGTGQSANSGIFNIPSKLYGRNGELDNMYQAFQRAIRGSNEIVFVTGNAGVGKSALISEFEQKIEGEEGIDCLVAMGKCDKLQRNIPYFPIIKAFNEILDEILRNSSKIELLIWEKSLKKALGGVGRVLTDLIPSLEKLIGSQPNLPIVTGTEAINRFNYAFQQFVSTIATKNRPLILVIDDLQWADKASLSLVKSMAISKEVKFFMLQGTYLENEGNANPVLMETIESIRNLSMKTGIRKVYTLNIHNLQLHDIQSLVAETLKVEYENVKELSALIYQKTYGNPFFARQLFRKLYNDGYISFDTYRYIWYWDIKEIQKVNITENVVDLMVEKLKKLPSSTLLILKIASCLGRDFDLITLQNINQRIQTDTYDTAFNATLKHLRKAKEEGLIIQERDQYQFAHGRIHHEIVGFNNQIFQRKVHLHIGRLLFNRLKKEENTINILDVGRKLPADIVFKILNHWNKGIRFIDSKIEKSELAALNLIAGKKAISSGAFDAAFRYFKTGVDLLYEDSWRRDYKLTLHLYSNLMDAAFLNGHFDELNKYFKIIKTNITQPTDAVAAYEVMIQMYSAQEQLDVAVNHAIQFSRKIGIRFPKKATKIRGLLSVIKMQGLMFRKKIEDLLELPDMTDKRAYAFMRICKAAGPALYLGGNPYLPLFFWASLKNTIKYGNSPYAIFCYGGFGMINSIILKKYARGYEYQVLNSQIYEKYQIANLLPFAGLVNNTFLIHPKKHLRESIDPTKKAYQVGLESGSIEFTAYVGFTNAYFSFFIGEPLSEVMTIMEKYINEMGAFQQVLATHRMKIYQQTFYNLLNETDQPHILKGEVYDEDAMLPKELEKSTPVIRCNLLTNKLILAYLFGKNEMAYQYACEAEELSFTARGSYMLRMYYFYSTLTYIRMFDKKTVHLDIKYPKLKRKIVKQISMLRKWSDAGHENFLHKYKFAEAEWSRVEGKESETVKLYRDALILAEKENFVNEVAMISETAGVFFYKRGDMEKAKAYLNKAVRSYQEWEAHAKVLDIKLLYKDIFI